MKSFLDAWLSEASAMFVRDFSAEILLIPVEQPPPSISGLSLSVAIAGSRVGKFTVLTDRIGLQTLLAHAKVTEPTVDAVRDTEIWKDLLFQIANAAAESIGNVQVESVEEMTWKLGIPVAAYELRLGSVAIGIAFADETEEAVQTAYTNGSHKRISEAESEKSQGSFDLLMDVELEVSLRFGSREMPLNAVLELGPGDVVELDRHVAEPVDLLVGDKIIARGEVVLVNGNFGFNVLQVAEPERRLESIRCLF
jgi:flagellar motor switch protein FliN